MVHIMVLMAITVLSDCNVKLKNIVNKLPMPEMTRNSEILVGEAILINMRTKKSAKHLNYKKKAEAQELKNQSRALYDRYTSTGKMVAQNSLLGSGAEFYRNARARGNTRGQAFVESQLSVLVSRRRDREAYGEATWSAM